jgi:LAO/AO transport system kinase
VDRPRADAEAPSDIAGGGVATVRAPIDRRALGRALTRLANASVADILAASPDHRIAETRIAAPRIGLTGPPGAGKSSLGGRLAVLRAATRRVGVLAIDPSSPRTGGAILGDRIRMDDLEGAEHLFVRSLASRTAGDGLAQNIPELLHAMDVAGFDEVILETVGVGQAEHAVRHQVDTLVLVLNPESGDIVQAMKAGIMELADIYLVNKSDLPGAARLAGEIQRVLHIAGSPSDGWLPPVLQSSIADPASIVRLSAQIDRHLAWRSASADGAARLAERARYRLRSLLERRVAEITGSLPAALLQQPLTTQFARAIGRLAPGDPSPAHAGEPGRAPAAASPPAPASTAHPAPDTDPR